MRATLLIGTLVALGACGFTQAPPLARATISPQATASAHPTPSASATQATSSAPVEVTASYARTQPGPTDPNAGSISGLVNCACGGMPSQDVYAISTDGGRFYATQTVNGQTRWHILSVGPGQYYVYAVERLAEVQGGTYVTPRRFNAGYTVAIACGLSVSCTDHSPVAVVVIPGRDTGGVGTFDWYSTDFPRVPVDGPPQPFLKAAPPFATADAAAAYGEVVTSDALVVAGPADCPENRACVWPVSSRTDSGAAYYVVAAGVNGQSITCVLYLYDGAEGWLGYDTKCGTSAIFPAVGAKGHVRLGIGETGCVNVHESPSLSGRVVACLVTGTSVTVDDGPIYVPSGLRPGTDTVGYAYWWHLAGRGWMVHPYLAS